MFCLIVYTLYHLAKDLDIQQALRTEVSGALGADASPVWSKLNVLPLLDGIVTETLGVHPPVSSSFSRVTPKQGAQIGDTCVPGDTIVSVPIWSIHHDARYFVEPDSWIPERWFSKPEMVKDRNALFPFSVGPFNCAGKYFAVMETKLFIAKVVSAFDVTFAPGEDGVAFVTEARDFDVMELPISGFV